MVQIEINQGSYQLDEDDLEEENDYGLGRVCVVRVGACDPEGQERAGHYWSCWKLQDAEDGQTVDA